MNRSERWQYVRDIPIPHIQRLLKTSALSNSADGIDMGSARWFDERKKPQLILETDVTFGNQGWDGIAYGGFIAKLIDGVAGVTGVITAHPYGKKGLASQLHVDFLRPIPIYTAVQTIVEVEAVKGDTIICSARIINAYETKTFVQGSLQLHMVDQIRNGLPKSTR